MAEPFSVLFSQNILHPLSHYYFLYTPIHYYFLIHTLLFSYYFHSSPCSFFVNVLKAKLAELVLESYPVQKLPLFIRCKALSKERECEGCLSE